ncbi:LytR C-terminal domain-containing protein [Actinomadura keratinilytica]
MGGKYRITGDKYPACALRAAAASWSWPPPAACWPSDSSAGEPSSSSTSSPAVPPPRRQAARTAPRPPPASPRPRSPPPAPGRIKVNVLNATERSGLAKATADALKKRGFAIGEVGNATEEYDKKVKGTVLLLGAADAVDGAFPVLATQVGGAKQKVEAPLKGEPAKADAAEGEGEGESDEAAKGPRKPNEVDLIIGDGFKKLAPEAAATGALKALNAPKPSPSPSSGGRC